MPDCTQQQQTLAQREQELQAAAGNKVMAQTVWNMLQVQEAIAEQNYQTATQLESLAVQNRDAAAAALEACQNG